MSEHINIDSGFPYCAATAHYDDPKEGQLEIAVFEDDGTGIPIFGSKSDRGWRG